MNAGHATKNTTPTASYINSLRTLYSPQYPPTTEISFTQLKWRIFQHLHETDKYSLSAIARAMDVDHSCVSYARQNKWIPRRAMRPRSSPEDKIRVAIRWHRNRIQFLEKQLATHIDA